MTDFLIRVTSMDLELLPSGGDIPLVRIQRKAGISDDEALICFEESIMKYIQAAVGKEK